MKPIRRNHLGPCASAALPTLWKAIARRNWSHADFGRAFAHWLASTGRPAEFDLSSGRISKLLYGDVEADRRVATFCADRLGVKAFLWEKKCPPNWRPHPYEELRRARRDDFAATGTDGE